MRNTLYLARTRLRAIGTASQQRQGVVQALAIGLVAVLTLALRMVQLGPSFNIFIDEVTYVLIGRGASQTLAISLHGKPFFLHPPAFFYVEAAYLWLVRPPASLVAQIYAARGLVVLFAALSSVLICVIVRRSVGLLPALLAALLFACDPFVIRMNSLVMLDTPAMFWVLAGYALLITALPSDLLAPSGLRAPIGRWRLVGAGVAFGLAILTKDMMVGLTVVPLAGCALLGWVLPRRQSLLVAVTACLTYLPYLVAVAMSGHWALFIDQKTSGLQRVLGGVRVTGLNRADGPSLVERVLARLADFGPTYLLIGLGVLGALILLPRRSAVARLLVAWMGGVCFVLAMSMGFGTIEEQFFYWLVVTAAPVAVIGLTVGLRSGLLVRFQRPLLYAVSGMLVLSVAWSSVQWFQVHTTPDNGYEQVLAWLEQRPPKEKVSSTSETGQFLLQAEGRATGPWGKWGNLQALRGWDPEYLIISTLQVIWDDNPGLPALLKWAESNGELVVRVDGHRNDAILLYRITPNPAERLNTAGRSGGSAVPPVDPFTPLSRQFGMNP